MNTAPQETSGKKPTVIIVGGGFGGLQLAKDLDKTRFRVVLLDKNNYHQFQPLFYQVATAGLEPSAISFPFRKIFQHQDITFKMTSLLAVHPAENTVETAMGNLVYDYLVLATGATNNFFGNENLEKFALGMKSTSEALYLRNTILSNFEAAENTTDIEERTNLLNITIVGGGPTGIELAGAIVELKNFILPKDYPDIDFSLMNIKLIESSPQLLNVMSAKSGATCEQYLKEMGVEILLNERVLDYDGTTVSLKNNPAYTSKCVIWAAGVKPIPINGIPESAYAKNGRIYCDGYNKVNGFENVFALGDLALLTETNYPQGHPQVAPVAIQQAKNMADNFNRISKSQPLRPFKYRHQGALATVGRNKAVIEFPKNIFLKGFLAWLIWLFVHLMSIVGVKNRFFIFINWAYSYFTYDQPLRLILKSKK